MCDRLLNKSDKLPLRVIFARTLEIFGKVLIMPCVLFVFLFTFPGALRKRTRIGYGVFFVALAIFVASREYNGFRNSWKEALVKIRAKIENPASTTISNTELFVFNIFFLGKVSRSPSHYHKWKRDVKKEYEAEEARTITHDPHLTRKLQKRSTLPAGEVEMLYAVEASDSDDENTSSKLPTYSKPRNRVQSGMSTEELVDSGTNSGSGEAGGGTLNAMHDTSGGYEL